MRFMGDIDWTQNTC